jgi:hypothetical protein
VQIKEAEERIESWTVRSMKKKWIGEWPSEKDRRAWTAQEKRNIKKWKSESGTLLGSLKDWERNPDNWHAEKVSVRVPVLLREKITPQALGWTQQKEVGVRYDADGTSRSFEYIYTPENYVLLLALGNNAWELLFTISTAQRGRIGSLGRTT